MAQDPSDTTLLNQLKAGADPLPAQKLWERYFARLAGLARRKMQGGRRRVEDEEDVALSAMDSFFRGMEQGKFAQVENRDDIWQVLALLAERKHIDRLRRETAQKRGSGNVRGDSVFVRNDASRGGIDEMAGQQPRPEFVLAFAEECQRLFDLLGKDDLRQVAQLKSDGFSTEEIAEQLGCSTRSVERKLKTIREIWAAEGESSD